MVNGFCLELVRGDHVSMEQLDEYARGFAEPNRHLMRPLPAKFFSKRIVHKVGAHCKAFAGECITAVAILSYADAFGRSPARPPWNNQQCACANKQTCIKQTRKRSHEHQASTDKRTSIHTHIKQTSTLHAATGGCGFQQGRA
eukprot:9473289-Pyramimonas_sp.AAC.1